MKKNPLDINAGIWGLIVNVVIFVVVSLIIKQSKVDVEADEEAVNA